MVPNLKNVIPVSPPVTRRERSLEVAIKFVNKRRSQTSIAIIIFMAHSNARSLNIILPIKSGPFFQPLINVLFQKWSSVELR